MGTSDGQPVVQCPTCKGAGTVTPKASRFVAPTVEEVKAYCQERNNSVDPETWHAHYTSNGWKVGRNPMKDWKAAVRTWERSSYGKQTNTSRVQASAGKYSGIGTIARDE